MRDYQRFYKELNDRQRLAVDTIDGPVLVLAGPGTGKTQLLSIRAASILTRRKNVSPENILILTYTNSAAKAMKERLARIIGPEGYDIEVGTFHSFANSILKESEDAANYVGDKLQMNEIEQVRAVQYVLDHAKGIEEIRPFRAPYLYLDEIRRKIGELKRDGITPEGLEEYTAKKNTSLAGFEDRYIKRIHAFAIVYRMYEDLKEGRPKAKIFDERGRYDFDDMILFATEALKNEKDFRERYQKRYSYVMVDEYQDTNGAQLELLFALLSYRKANLCCVGDDDQSIYRFQGASVGNFKLLESRFPDLTILNLKDNYRSAKELIDISSKIINLIPQEERMSQKLLEAVKDYRNKEIEFREFTTVEEELIYIIDRIKELKGRIERDDSLTGEERAHPYNNIAILVRKRGSILSVIDALLKSGIPYATDGKEDIGGERRVKQLLDALGLAHADSADFETRDLLLYKILTTDYLQIPHIDVLRFLSYVMVKREKGDHRNVSILEEFLSYFSSRSNEIKFQGEERLKRAYIAISRLLEDAHARPVHTILMDYVRDAGLFKYILKAYTDKNILRIRELRALSSFINMVKASDLADPAIRLGDFMQEIKTRNEHGLPIQGSLVTMTQDGVRVFTAHGSKGQEFHTVIIPFCLQNKNWPIRPIPEKIPLPLDLFKTRERARSKELLRHLTLNDETRLFYVAMTRAKANLIFTASPSDDTISSFYLTGLDIRRSEADYPPEDEIMTKALESADLEDPFIGTEGVLKDLVSNLSLNPTRLNTYLFCKRKFLYNDILKLPGQKKKSLIFGNCVHKALEETYKEYKKSGRFPSFKCFQGHFARELRFQGAGKIIELHCLSAERMNTLKGWFDIASKNPVVPLGLERRLIVTVGDGIIFTGKYDKIEWEDEKAGTVRILDYKTGKPDDHLKDLSLCDDLASEECDGYLRQLVAYKLLFEADKRESKGRIVKCGSLVFIEPVSSDIRRLGYRKGEYVTKRIEISSGMVADLEKIIKSAWNDIKNLQFEKFPKRDKDKCARCDFGHLCWD